MVSLGLAPWTLQKERETNNSMKKTSLVLLLSCLFLGGLFAASCSPQRQFGDATGGGGEGAAGTTSGGTSPVGSGGTGGTPSASAGAGAVSMGGGNAGSSAGSESAAGAGEDPECTDLQKLCGGACVDIDDPTYGCDPTLCTTDACPDAPGAELVCDSGQCLLGSCGGGTKMCDGQCVAVTDPAYGCGAATCDASTCPSQATGATVVCEKSACVIGTCPKGYKKCSDKCVAISDPSYGCGETTCDASSCPAAGAATLVCQGSACVTGTCGPGTKKCGSNCVTTDANSGCADAARCAACANNEACSGSPTTCQCVPTPKATACTGKCGSVPNGCGGTYTCGTCSSPQTCGGGGTANVCGCTKTAMGTACSGKSCGSVADGCGGSYTCGMCSSPTPVCVSNACKQCSAASDCPSGTFNCTNNICACRVANSANLIKDGGFDSSSDLSNWTANTAQWTNSDADDCPGSGAMTIDGTITRCFQVPPAGPGASYSLGIRYKATGNGAGCAGLFYAASNCTVGLGPDFINMGASQSSAWRSEALTSSVPEGTSSIYLQCQGNTITIDQIYLRAGLPGGGF
jgi:hypothetical protein